MSNLDEFRTEVNSILTEFNENLDSLVNGTRSSIRSAVAKLTGEPYPVADSERPMQTREKGY